MTYYYKNARKRITLNIGGAEQSFLLTNKFGVKKNGTFFYNTETSNGFNLYYDDEIKALAVISKSSNILSTCYPEGYFDNPPVVQIGDIVFPQNIMSPLHGGAVLKGRWNDVNVASFSTLKDTRDVSKTGDSFIHANSVSIFDTIIFADQFYDYSNNVYCTHAAIVYDVFGTEFINIPDTLDYSGYISFEWSDISGNREFFLNMNQEIYGDVSRTLFMINAQRKINNAQYTTNVTAHNGFSNLYFDWMFKKMEYTTTKLRFESLNTNNNNTLLLNIGLCWFDWLENKFGTASIDVNYNTKEITVKKFQENAPVI